MRNLWWPAHRMGLKVTYSVTPRDHSYLPIQSQNLPSSILQTDASVEAKILDLLDCDSPRPNTDALAAGSSYHIPGHADGMRSRGQVRHVKIKAMRGKGAVNNPEASISAG